jgi:kynurenine formamidase
VVLVGGDTESVEINPSVDPENPHPVHIELLIERGIHILELVHVEDLSRDEAYEFLFICLPLRVQGATGSMVRPIAIV